MGLYVDMDYLIEAYGLTEIQQLSDRDRSGDVDASVLASAITRAEAQVDAYLGARYALPLASVPEVVKSLAGALAYYYLFRTRATERARQGYEDAVAQLRDISAGKMRVDGAEQPVTATGAAPVGSKADENRTFTSEGLQGYITGYRGYPWGG